MSDEKIAEIRARHEAGPIGHLPIAAFSLADDDRSFLLAEVDRLRSALQGIDALDPDVPDALVAGALRVIVSQMAEIARAALEGKP
jgi:hypothetical protein